ncbi:hypothetical protein IF1G_07727 [Cordyceps javanica]|uniref:Uncharacterized protein n=1 Tax=Cordyceps javanica TaxID=43265 RepID=A0A545VJ73_9HYPO|nr:hypothetical protein IF1G_07727 [Cordyceps javanica]TQW01706.1 hypothetical protein IF2G_10785 [Cordyceps javanica]
MTLAGRKNSSLIAHLAACTDIFYPSKRLLNLRTRQPRPSILFPPPPCPR